jgi:tyrosinase
LLFPSMIHVALLCLLPANELQLNSRVAGTRIRKSYVTLTATEIADFQNACVALKAVDPGATDANLLGWDDFVKLHGQNGAFAHRGPAFLAWHREFLFRFENALRSVAGGAYPNVTVPYWDWTVDPFPASIVGGDGAASTDIVTTGPFASSTGDWPIAIGQLGGPQLKRNFAAPLPGTIFTAGQLNALMAHEIFDSAPWNDLSVANTSFRNVLEGWVAPGFHNSVHVLIGGNMMTPQRAVNDPVFWLHHANVDRIWGKWQELYPYDFHHMPFGNEAADGHNAFDTMTPFTATPCEATNMVAYGYEYDDCVGPCTYDAGHFFEGLTYSQVLMKQFV